MAAVNWNAHGKAMQRHLNKRTFLVKLVHGLLPTNLKLHRSDHSRNTCPSCHIHVKSWKHYIAARVVATVVAEAGLAPAMRERDPEVLLSFWTVHFVFEHFEDALAAICASYSTTKVAIEESSRQECVRGVSKHVVCRL